MTTPSSHEGYRKIARGALRGRGSVVAKTDWEVFLHGFCDTNQLGDSRRIYDCLIDLFPTPEAVLRWPVYDPNTGERLELPETGGCQNFRSRIGAGNWLRRNAENWEGIRAFLRCDTPEKKRAARDFTGRTTRDYIGSLNRRLRDQITGAGLKGADMHLLWGGCEVPVIDIQLVRYMAPHVLGMDFKEHVRERLIEHKAEGHALQLDPDRPASERRLVDARDIDVDSNVHISAMEKAEIGKIQINVKDYNRWREAAYQMAEAEGIPVNQWHVATWLESRAGGDPDKNLRQRTRAEAAEDNLRLEATQRFTARTFGPTDFPEVPASWPLPAERYPNRERRNRLAQMRSDGVSTAEMAEREGITAKDVASDLAYYDLQQSRLFGTPSAFVGFETPFGFDDNIRVMWQDWVQYKIDDTPVIVKRVKAKPGTKVNPRYKGATALQQLDIDFRLRASNRKDMQKIDFLLERLREDNPTMTVRVNVKTNGTIAHRNLPSWQERPYRLEPAAWLPQDERPSPSSPSSPSASAFTGIDSYASAIMELV